MYREQKNKMSIAGMALYEHDAGIHYHHSFSDLQTESSRMKQGLNKRYIREFPFWMKSLVIKIKVVSQRLEVEENGNNYLNVISCSSGVMKKL